MTHSPARPVSVLIVAIGGYGQHYVNALFDLVERGLVERRRPAAELVGVVDPAPEHSPVWPRIAAANVPAFSTIERFYEAGHRADLAVIASPIHWHVPQSLVALDHGSRVLCDKPLCALVEEGEQLCRRCHQRGLWAMIGYQWAFSSGIQALKRDLLAGRFGAPKRAQAMCCWPREFSYYRRNDWAGRLRHVGTGRWVLDSPANNAMAHFLHNLFFLLGPQPHSSARPAVVQAEMYRAYDIESADTTFCRARTEEGVDLLFYASHVTQSAMSPRFRIEFDAAVVTCGVDGPDIVAVDRYGEHLRYPPPDATPQFYKLEVAIDACARGDGRGEHVICGPEAALSQTVCINAMHQSVAAIVPFPRDLIRQEAVPARLVVGGLDDVVAQGWERRRLPSEMDVPWAAPGKQVRTT